MNELERKIKEHGNICKLEKCMTYLLMKDGKQSGNERQARDMQDNRSRDASCCLHGAIPLELRSIPVF